MPLYERERESVLKHVNNRSTPQRLAMKNLVFLHGTKAAKPSCLKPSDNLGKGDCVSVSLNRIAVSVAPISWRSAKRKKTSGLTYIAKSLAWICFIRLVKTTRGHDSVFHTHVANTLAWIFH